MCWKRGHNQSVIPLITTSQSILMIICYFSPYLPPSNIYFISENVRLMYFIVLISDGVDTNMVGGYWFVCRFVDTGPDFSIFSVWMSKDNSSVELNEMSRGKERKSVLGLNESPQNVLRKTIIKNLLQLHYVRETAIVAGS